jgi:hypothetical protein
MVTKLEKAKLTMIGHFAQNKNKNFEQKEKKLIPFSASIQGILSKGEDSVQLTSLH